MENAVQAVRVYLCELQTTICQALAAADGSKIFISDHWEREGGGGGCSRILLDGAVIEKGGVNFSHVYGERLPHAATSSEERRILAGRRFEALGISLVIHPRNPYVPTCHANLRLLVVIGDNEQAPVWWFGGGYDLTPYYGFVEDCVHWHQTAKAACDPFGTDLYPRFKAWCDRYFYLAHREEPRGIGGLFFDDWHPWDFERSFAFVRSVGDSFLSGYGPIVARRKNHPFGEHERAFQAYRRARYVEFNLIYDRGTLFGLQSGGRTESILMSMPPVAHWGYCWQPPADSVEQQLYDVFLKPTDWLSRA